MDLVLNIYIFLFSYGIEHLFSCLLDVVNCSMFNNVLIQILILIVEVNNIFFF